MSAWLPLAIGAVAVLYASVGHAGATGYLAVLTLAGLPADVVRPTALVLNVCVATIATAQFTRAGHLRCDLLGPLLLGSVPAAFVGGSIGLHPAAFAALVGGVLAVSALRLAVRAVVPGARDAEVTTPPRPPALAVLGGAIGLLAGLTGVGGGVFLAPALIGLRAARVREAAAVSAAFILVNSLAGLGGWLAAGRTIPAPAVATVGAAVVGGAAGSQLGAFRLPVRALEGLMAVVLSIAAVNLLRVLAVGS